MGWRVPKIWQGGRCFVIGGGPSILEQFRVPADLADLIRNPAERDYGPWSLSELMSPIHGEHCIAVNNAYLIGDWIDSLFFGDSNWFIHHRHKLAQWPGIKVSCNDRFANIGKDNPEKIQYLERDHEKVHGISTAVGKVSWNKNSGAAAINLAAHFGVSQIVLLGFDMSLDEDGRMHFHQGHIEMPNKISGGERARAKAVQKTFNRHQVGFPKIAEDADRLGIEIVNANPSSTIEAFRKADVWEVL